jgi:limonene 1,2-monooxygenase
MRFGVFLAPFHRVGEDPTMCFARDLELMRTLDDLGFDEAWIGEHHSAGRETIAEPMLFCAAAAERTRRLVLGTGVTSLALHHPFMVAERAVQLDHMTRGRFVLGCGPGMLASDAFMMGIDASTLRRRMNESLDAIVALLRAEGPVDVQTDWFTLREARLQLASYTHPHVPVAVATTSTPSGPMAAGRNGCMLLLGGGGGNVRFDQIWGWQQEAAAAAGRTTSRDGWRVVMSCHLADSKEQAIEDLRVNYPKRAYFGDAKVPGRGLMIGGNAKTIDEALMAGALLVGTPDEAIARIDGMLERTGGFGGIMLGINDYASTQAQRRSLELFARYVMPHFRGQIAPVVAHRDWVEDNLARLFGDLPAASVQAYRDAGKEIPAHIHEQMAARNRMRASRQGHRARRRRARAGRRAARHARRARLTPGSTPRTRRRPRPWQRWHPPHPRHPMQRRRLAALPRSPSSRCTAASSTPTRTCTRRRRSSAAWWATSSPRPTCRWSATGATSTACSARPTPPAPWCSMRATSGR